MFSKEEQLHQVRKPKKHKGTTKGAKRLKVWAKVKKSVVAKRGSFCEVCGVWVGVFIESHHIIPKARGGKDTEDNMQLLCAKHHRGKEGFHG